MEIGPVDQAGQAPADAGHARQDQLPPGNKPEEAADSVEISLEARALLAQAADESRIDDVQTASSRLELIREKAASGHYDKPEIIEVVAEKLTDQMY